MTINQKRNYLDRRLIHLYSFKIQRPFVAPLAPIQLIDSKKCKVDIQKYCVKGGLKSISNFKVLQCIDDLDNVSFFTLKRLEYFLLLHRLSI